MRYWESLTAFWIAKALKAKSVIVAVPSLALVKQSLGDWTAEYLAEGIQPEWLAVCSDESVGSTKDADSTVATVYEMGIPTNPTDEELDLFLKRKTSNPKVIFTTYQSAEKLCTAAKRCKKKFDLLIADEAHKTAGKKSKSFASLLFDENIRISKRLFMTATERVYNGSKDAVVSMDDEGIYGTVFHALTFKKAIEQEIICDYKIVTIGLSNDQLKNSIEEKVLLDVFGVGFEKELDAHTLAAGVALKKPFINIISGTPYPFTAASKEPKTFGFYRTTSSYPRIRKIAIFPASFLPENEPNCLKPSQKQKDL